MDRDAWLALLTEAIAGLRDWESGWPDVPAPPADTAARDALGELVARLKGNYPFFHPQYVGQMLKPPHPVAWAAYALTSLVNPNNHALDGGPPTAAMEREAVAALAGMLGFDPSATGHLGHLTAGGTVANLEALWVARCTHPDKAVAFGDNAHYTHARMCGVLGVDAVRLPSDLRGRLALTGLSQRLAKGDIGTLVVTLGTTGFGAFDPLHEILPIAREYGVRVHVDAAYGGFFALLARRAPPLVDPAPFAALGGVDSIVIDPHKHGLQPYGCGCVLFADPGVGRFYAHDSPYTYFTSDELHLGEITLECSRAGASAAALWTTLRAIPLAPDAGLGALLAAGRRAALSWAQAIRASNTLRLVVEPESDILCFSPWPGQAHTVPASRVTAMSEALFQRAADAEIHLAKYRLDRAFLAPHWPEVAWDTEDVVVIRSVVMKPEHATWWPRIHKALVQLADDVIAAR